VFLPETHALNCLIHLNDIIRLPGLIKEGFQRAIETDIGKPTLSREGLDPILFLTLGSFGATVDINFLR
jgi:hypothetical protein